VHYGSVNWIGIFIPTALLYIYHKKIKAGNTSSRHILTILVPSLSLPLHNPLDNHPGHKDTDPADHREADRRPKDPAYPGAAEEQAASALASACFPPSSLRLRPDSNRARGQEVGAGVAIDLYSWAVGEEAGRAGRAADLEGIP